MEQKKKQTMHIGKIFIVLLVIVANILAGTALYKSWRNEDIVNTMKVIPEQTAETAQTHESAQPHSLDANLTASWDNGKLIFVNPKIPLQTKKGNTVVVNMPDGSYTMELDTQNGFANIHTDAGTVKVIVNDSDDAAQRSLYKLNSEDGQTIFAGSVHTGANNIVVQGIPDTEEKMQQMSDICAYIIDNSACDAEQATVYIADVAIPENWTKSIVCDTTSISVTDGNKTISAAPYDKTAKESGFTQQETIEVFGTVYSGKYTNSDTGAKPYLYQASDGTTWLIVASDS